MHRQSSAPGADAGGGPASPALAEELRKLVLEQMAKRLERMFEGADNLLLSMADRARGAEEQRRNFDTRHLVKKHRADLTRVFLDELGAAFKPGADAKKKPENSDIDFEELHLWKTRTIDESIAVNNIAVKAENSNEQPLREIDRRLDWLIHERGAPISPAALKPSTLCNSFRVGAQSLNLDFQIELLIYKLFDQLVVAGLNEVYGEALNLLERGGVTATVLKGYRRAGPASTGGGTPAASPSQPAMHGTQSSHGSHGPQSGQGSQGSQSRQGPQPPPPGPYASEAEPIGMQTMAGLAEAAGLTAGLTGSSRAMAAGGQTTGGMPVLDRRTFDALRSAHVQPAAGAGAGYGDAELAGDLSQLASGIIVPGWGASTQVRANVQCVDLVGRMFNGILEDPSVPQSLKGQLDELRFSVIKNALADRSFFANTEHPIRKLVNELATMAAGARATGAGSSGHLANLMEMIQSQLQVGAKTVKAAAVTAVPLAEAEAERFLDDQLVQGKARRQALIDRARKVVNEEVQLRLVGRHIPDAARPMVNSGVAPLMGLGLLRHGMDSDAWRKAIQLLENVIGALDSGSAAAPDAAPPEQLAAQVERDLLAAGMLAPRLADLLVGLNQGFESAARERRAAPPAAAAATTELPAMPPPEGPADLLRRLLVPGEWFKVHDAERGETRWLKIVAHHLDDERPEDRGRVEFAEFSGKNPLRVTADDLIEHLRAGLSEPFDQSPGAKAALASLKEQSGAAPVDLAL